MGIKGGAEAGIAGLKPSGLGGDAESPTAAPMAAGEADRLQRAAMGRVAAGNGRGRSDPDLVPQCVYAVVWAFFFQVYAACCIPPSLPRLFSNLICQAVVIDKS